MLLKIQQQKKKRFRYQNDKHKNETNNDASSRSFVVEESN